MLGGTWRFVGEGGRRKAVPYVPTSGRGHCADDIPGLQSARSLTPSLCKCSLWCTLMSGCVTDSRCCRTHRLRRHSGAENSPGLTFWPWCCALLLLRGDIIIACYLIIPQQMRDHLDSVRLHEVQQFTSVLDRSVPSRSPNFSYYCYLACFPDTTPSQRLWGQ